MLQSNDIPLTLYAHFPWCVRKCPYCDFNSHPLRGDLPEREYLGALLLDLEAELGEAGARPITSIFFGGGTPSLADPSTIGAVIEFVATNASLQANAEITLEANPGASERSRFAGYRSAGVTRLSIGAQSFDDRMLSAIGRIHDAGAAHAAFKAARAAGFENINVDVMFGLPGQDTTVAAADIDNAISLAPEHLSYYQLTLEPNTMFHLRPPVLPEEDEICTFQSAGLERLEAAGFARYEVSAFARDGRECAHNRNYWTFGDYLGVGAGAHGKLTRAGGVHRYSKPRHPADYIGRRGPCRVGERDVEGDELAFEFMLNALRLTKGFEVATFETRTGLDASKLDRRIAPLVRAGLLEHTAGRVWATRRGFDYLDEILQQLLPEVCANTATGKTHP